jgi:hypothetical protein
MRQHDERNAAMLSELRPEARPDGAYETAHWIWTELERRGDIENAEYAEYAERDGRKCGEAALNMLAVVELYAMGKPAMDPHAHDAHELRARRVAEHLVSGRKCQFLENKARLVGGQKPFLQVGEISRATIRDKTLGSLRDQQTRYLLFVKDPGRRRR